MATRREESCLDPLHIKSEKFENATIMDVIIFENVRFQRVLCSLQNAKPDSFQIPQVWRAFSKRSVLVWTVGPTVEIKPWPNGVASRRKLKIWVYLRLRLARPCVHLRWLALSLIEIKFARKSKQVLHGLATQPMPTQVEWNPLIYY